MQRGIDFCRWCCRLIAMASLVIIRVLEILQEMLQLSERGAQTWRSTACQAYMEMPLFQRDSEYCSH